MSKRNMPYEITPLIAHAAAQDRGSALAMFLKENAGSIFGTWCGVMRAVDQRCLLGNYFGKGFMVIKGDTERLTVTRKVAFGMDFDIIVNISWSELEREYYVAI